MCSQSVPEPFTKLWFHPWKIQTEDKLLLSPGKGWFVGTLPGWKREVSRTEPDSATHNFCSSSSSREQRGHGWGFSPRHLVARTKSSLISKSSGGIIKAKPNARYIQSKHVFTLCSLFSGHNSHSFVGSHLTPFPLQPNPLIICCHDFIAIVMKLCSAMKNMRVLVSHGEMFLKQRLVSGAQMEINHESQANGTPCASSAGLSSFLSHRDLHVLPPAEDPQQSRPLIDVGAHQLITTTQPHI